VKTDEDKTTALNRHPRLGWLASGCRKAETKERPLKPVRAKAAEMRPASSGGVRYSASIRPNSQVDMAFKVGGYVEAIAQVRDASGGSRYLQAGDVVGKGTVLASLRRSDYLAKVNQAGAQHAEARSALERSNAQLEETRRSVETSRAQVADAQATFERASLDFERAKTLHAAESITKTDYDAAKSQYDASRARGSSDNCPTTSSTRALRISPCRSKRASTSS
jgi:multidrug resistance efflux pump